MSLSGNELYRFDDFELQPSRRALVRGGERIQITPKTFEVLLCLVQNAGRVVLKEDLLKSVWPESFVEESNLPQHIFWLRKALGDKSDYIVTIPGRGYEFRAPVHAISEPAVSKAGPGVSFRIQQALEVTHVVIEERRPTKPLRAKLSRRGTILAVSAIALGVIVLLLYGVWRWRHRAIPGDHHEVVLADFSNRTGDSAFDSSLRTLLAIDLNQSNYLVVASDSDTQTVLKLMHRNPSETLVPALALEVCQRMNDQAMLAGTITNVGNKYLVILSATDCQTEKPLTQIKTVVDDRQDVIQAVDTAAANMRKQLGETLKSHTGGGRLLQPAPTSSLDALRAYSQAQQLCPFGKMQDAIALYKHALELDPKFAVAYLDLGLCYRSDREQALAAASITKAYELRNQEDDALRLRIEAAYEDVVVDDSQAQLRAATEWTELYPNQPQAWMALNAAEGALGRPDLSMEAARHALALSPDNGRVYVALANALYDLGRIEESKAVCHEAIRRKIDNEGIHELLFNYAYAEHDAATIEEQTAWLTKTDEGMAILEYPLFTEGKAHAAVSLWEHDIDALRKAGLTEHADRHLGILMHREADYGMDEELKRQLRTADLSKYPLNLVYANLELGRIGAAQAALRALDATMGTRSEYREIYLPQARASVAIALHRPAEAIADLEISRPYQGRSPESDLIRGWAFMAAHNPQAAEVEFRRIIDHPYFSPEAPSHPLAYLGLARALAQEGKYAESRKEYEALFAIWKDADADLKPLQQARQEFEKLH